jgi:predicted nucleic acid-binding protein
VIVLDACVLIAHLDVSDAHHDRAFELLQGLAEEPFAAGALTLAEVLVGPARAGGLERAGAALRALAVETIPIGDAAPAKLAGLRAATGLRLPDCCALLAAEQVRGGLATFDDRLAAAALEHGVPVHG